MPRASGPRLLLARDEQRERCEQQQGERRFRERRRRILERARVHSCECNGDHSSSR